MRIVISDVAGMQPVVMESMSTVICAADDGSKDGTAPIIVQGRPNAIANLAAGILASVRDTLGANAFESIVKYVRETPGRVEDITPSVRTPDSPPAGQGSRSV